jgi:hypothetical protein
MQENYGNCTPSMVIFKNYWGVIFIGKFWKVGKVGAYISIAPPQIDQVNYYLHNNSLF